MKWAADAFDKTTKILALVPLSWICLGFSIKGAFFLSTGLWPESATYFNPVMFPAYLRPIFDLFILMIIYSFIYLPAILVLMAINFLVIRKDYRKFFTIWLPLFGGSTVIAFLLLRFFGKSFEFYT